jgi:hypoxanthine phosphoribosyltransferase
MNIDKNDVKVLFTKDEIEKRIMELSAKISSDYKGKELTMIGIIKGALPFFFKLSEKVNLAQRWDFMALSSYGDRTQSTGIVKINMDLGSSIEGKEVLIIEDIIDTGLTMNYLINNLKTRKPASLKICTLLFKEGNLKQKMKIDYVGFKIPKKFVVGFGLDCAESLRELPYIGYIKE